MLLKVRKGNAKGEREKRRNGERETVRDKRRTGKGEPGTGNREPEFGNEFTAVIRMRSQNG